MRTFATFGLLTACHYIATVLLLVLTFSSSMGRFDSGQPEGPIERGASVVVSLLGFPLLHGVLGGRGRVPWYFDGLLGHIPFALNSALWAGVILGCVRLYKRYRA